MDDRRELQGHACRVLRMRKTVEKDIGERGSGKAGNRLRLFIYFYFADDKKFVVAQSPSPRSPGLLCEFKKE